MNCEDCYYQDDITSSCTNDTTECVDEDQFVRALEPDDMEFFDQTPENEKRLDEIIENLKARTA